MLPGIENKEQPRSWDDTARDVTDEIMRAIGLDKEEEDQRGTGGGE